MKTEPDTALVLTGGGARAAYQVGALAALREIGAVGPCPFRILTGVSAGAINSVALALRADDFPGAVEDLAATWRSLSPDRVYRTDVRSLLSIGGRWMRQLGSGGLLGAHPINHLLDTSPLRQLLAERLPMGRLAASLAGGRLRAVAVTATSYHTGTAVTFYEGAGDIEPWVRSSRIGRADSLTIDHVLASAAIPIFFPPVAVAGALFGDGCVRMGAPLSPAIHLGADRILAIGVRYARTDQQTVELNRSLYPGALSLSEIGGVLLNAVFLDSLDSDVERLQRINSTLESIPPAHRARLRQPLRPIPLLVLRPSQDLGRLAVDQFRRFPASLRYLLRGIGATGERGWDLLSYLAFEPVYVRTLMELGYRDTLARRVELERFFSPRALAA